MDVRDAVRRRGVRAASHAVHGARALCADATPRRPGAGRVAAPWLSVRLLWLEPSWLWRLPTLVASAIAPEPVASAVVSAITQRRFFRTRVNKGGIRRFNEDSREGVQAR